ncbi:hypothetical protein [uncultured Paludibaculum sp.]|uniref:hypothetical protein n=1 Tax=uncultured Paludibaculum sp. TaxID=1765020 RepID=UPI002AAAC69E|nr:hypothetical protein [uncultured Paludibaculum sp.]
MRLIILTLICGKILYGQAEAVRAQSNDLVSVVRQVDVRKFSSGLLYEAAQEFVRDYASVPFGRLLIGTGPEVREYCGKGSNHISVENYFYRLRYEYPLGLKTWPRLALVLKLGDSAILRVRDGDRIQEMIVGRLTGSLSWKDQGYDILEVAPLYDPPDTIGGLAVFVRVRGSLSQDQVNRFTQDFSRIHPQFTYHVFVRQDTWFIDQPQFPFLYAFDQGGGLPTKDQFKRRQAMGSIARPTN